MKELWAFDIECLLLYVYSDKEIRTQIPQNALLIHRSRMSSSQMINEQVTSLDYVRDACQRNLR